MNIPSELLSEFVKATQSKEKPSTGTTVNGTTVEYNGSIYVKLDGSDLLTPVTTTVGVKSDERVKVLVQDHTATVIGNLTTNSARTDDVDNMGRQISEFDTVMAYKITTTDLQAVNATIENLRAKMGDFTELSALSAEFAELQAKYADIEYISANDAKILNAEIDSLKAKLATFTSVSTEDLDAMNADIDNLKAYNAAFTYVSADRLTAVNADIKNLDVKKLNATDAEITYANIDFTNINEAAIQNLFTEAGVIKYLTISEGTVVKELIGVTIKGDLIETGTLKADRLVVLGTDGNYYKLNLDGMDASVEVVEEDRIHGKTIVAESITAEKISVNDLVAFGATIGGFHIGDHSIYSGVKSSALNSTEGVYLGDSGEFSVGDSTNFLRYFYDETSDTYRLEVHASSLTLGGNNKTVQEELDELKAGVEPVEEMRESLGLARSEIDSLNATIKDFVRTAEGSSLVTQDDMGVYFDFSTYDESIGTLSKKMEHIVIGTTEDDKPMIELSADSDDFKAVLTNSDMEFRVGSATPTRVNNRGVDTDNITVNDEFKHGYFSWSVRDNGNYGLSWTGGTNLIPYSKTTISNSEYKITEYTPTSPLVVDEQYTISISLTPASGVTQLSVVMSEGMCGQAIIPVSGTSRQTITATFNASYADGKTPGDDIKYAKIELYQHPNDGSVTEATTIHWVKVEKGDIATPWSPAPSDIG